MDLIFVSGGLRQINNKEAQERVMAIRVLGRTLRQRHGAAAKVEGKIASGRARNPVRAIRVPQGGGRIVNGQSGCLEVRSQRHLLAEVMRAHAASTRNNGGRWLDGAGT